MRKILIAGGSGFVGGIITDWFLSKGDEVAILSRSGRAPKGAEGISWDGVTADTWSSRLEGIDAVINLCGAPISGKWTDAYRKTLLDSRVLPTKAIAAGISMCKTPPKVWINTSAVGFYGDTGSNRASEATRNGTGFLAELGNAWEDATTGFDLGTTRLVIARLGVVLDPEGGMLKQIKKIPSAGIGSGKQYVSWIHREDVARLFDWLIESDAVGPVNVCSPNPVTIGELMKAVCDETGLPPFPPMPAAIFKAISGVMGLEASVVLEGQRAEPVMALAKGFEFQFPEIVNAIQDLMHPAPEPQELRA